jgi:2'-5' RNA ligase
MELQSITTPTIPGYRVFEYLLVLSPPEDLREKITRVRKDFATTFRTVAGGGGRPHIAMVNFMQYGMMEERIIHRLKTIAMGYYPVSVELKDYGSFPTHSIFINVTTRQPIQQLVREIRSGAQRLMRLNDENKPHFMMEPNVTIASRLQPWQYEQGWKEYSNRHFTGRFVADGMLLLKRPAGERAYQIVQRFDFMNLPVNTRQGELFAGG